MGEMADYYIGEAMECDYLYAYGGMRTKTCRYCGRSGFRWLKMEDGTFRLGTQKTGQIHECQAYKKRKAQE